MTESIAGALLKQSVNLKMNPLSSGPELPSPPPNDPPISSVPGPGDIEAGKVSNPGTLAEKKEDLSIRQRLMREFWAYDFEDKCLICVGVGCLFGALICFIVGSSLLGIGFIIAFLAIAWCFRRIRILEVYKTLSESLDSLQAENEALKGHVGDLEQQNNELQSNVTRLDGEVGELEGHVDELEQVKVGLNDQLEAIKKVHDLVGEEGEEMIKKLQSMYGSYKSENDRHAQLLAQQSDFHMFQILQHFDMDFNGSIEGAEIENLIEYLRNKYSNFDESEIRALGGKIPMKEIKSVLSKFGDWQV